MISFIAFLVYAGFLLIKIDQEIAFGFGAGASLCLVAFVAIDLLVFSYYHKYSRPFKTSRQPVSAFFFGAACIVSPFVGEFKRIASHGLLVVLILGAGFLLYVLIDRIANFLSTLIPLEEVGGGLDLFRKYPPTSLDDLANFRAMLAALLVLPSLVSLLH